MWGIKKLYNKLCWVVNYFGGHSLRSSPHNIYQCKIQNDVKNKYEKQNKKL